jgi:predicted aldo/keto reductase-like oxidoreductase
MRRALSRRAFVAAGATGLAGAGLAAHAIPNLPERPKPAPESRNQREGMRYRLLGRTNLLVSVLSHGGEQLRADVFSAALDRGVNLLHIAQEYAGSFDEAAKVLPQRRGELFLAIKHVTPVDQFKGWLSRLKTDHADLVFHPTDRPDDARDQTGAIRERFLALRDAGLVRFLGITCHSNVAAVGRAAVEAGHWDAIMPQFGPGLRAEVGPVVDDAHEREMGVLGMKALANTTGDARKTAFQTALERRGLTSVLKGLPDFELLDMLVRAVGEQPDAEQQAALWRHVLAQRSETCWMCSRCAACPQGIAVEESLKCLLYYDRQLGHASYARQVYAALPRERTVAACVGCGTCERLCPNGLPVRDLLREADRVLS